MLDSINWYFHYFYILFFLGSALLFWSLDRSRWRAYRKVAFELGMEFHRQMPDETQDALQNQFRLFGTDTLSTFTAFFSGTFKARQVRIFNFSQESVKPDFGYRQGYQCFTFASNLPLPEVFMWPREDANPFGDESLSLDGFIPTPELLQLIKVSGRNGREISLLLESSLGHWLLEKKHVLVECREKAILLGWKGEIEPQQLPLQLHELSGILEDLEAHLSADQIMEGRT